MSRTNHWPKKDRAEVAKHIFDLFPRQERTAILDWIDSLDASFGFKITEHDGNTYLKAHDIKVQVDESPAVIELLRLWAKNELSPVPRNSLIRIDPNANMEAEIKKFLPGDPADQQPDEHLTDKDRKILLYMFKNGHDADNPIKKLAIAKRLHIGDDKNMMNNLKKLGLVKGKPGSGNGSYLTEKGWQRAERINRGPSKTV